MANPKPWKLEVTWICHDAYGDPVEVYLHVMDERERLLGRFDTKEHAVAYATRWAADRGFTVAPVVEPDDKATKVMLHPRPQGSPCTA